MVRLPRQLKKRLEAYGMTLKEIEPKQFGNHEDNNAEGQALWRTIQRLLDLEEAHRIRSRNNTLQEAERILREVDADMKAATTPFG